MKILILLVFGSGIGFAQIGPGGGGTGPCNVTNSATSGYVLTATSTSSSPNCTWQSAGAASVTEGAINNSEYVAVSGTNTLTGNTSTSYASYSAGFTVRLLIANTNTGAVTLQLNSIAGAKAVTKRSSGGPIALSGGELIATLTYTAVYDGTEFQISGLYTNGTNGQLLKSDGNGGFSTALSTTGSGNVVLSSGASINLSSATNLPCAAMPPLTGDTTSSSGSCATTTVKINGITISSLATGLVKNTTGTGVFSIAVAGTDYAAATNGSNLNILTSNGSGGFGTVIVPATGIATLLATPTSANLLSALTTKTGTGLAMFGTGPSASGVTLTDVTGSTQCLHANSSGVISGTGSDCGSGGGGGGTVTVVGSGSLTSTALVTGGGSQAIQTPSATTTLDSSGNISTPGTFTSGSGSGNAGAMDWVAGTVQATTASAFGWGVGATMTTAVRLISPNAVPAANQVMVFPSPTSNQSIFAWTTFSSTNLTDTANLVRNQGTNTGTSAMTLNMVLSSTADSLRVPYQASGVSGATGSLIEDSTGKNYHAYANGADAIIGAFAVSALPANTDCLKAVVNGSNYLIGDAGGACITGSAYQTIDSNGSGITQRSTVNFVSGSNATVSCVDNSGASRSDCTISASSSAGSRLDQITAATGANTISSGDNDQIWKWTPTSSGTYAWTITEGTASAAGGTSGLLNIATLSTSTLNPLTVTAGGTTNGIFVNTGGFITSKGAGGVGSGMLFCDASSTGKCIQNVLSGITASTTRNVTWQDAAITVAGTALANGGTNATLTASNGGIVYSTASALAILNGTATANQVLLSGSSTTPAWSTATYPATTTVSQILYSSSSNVVVGLATANSSVLVTNSSGVPSFSTALPNGTTAPTQSQLDGSTKIATTLYTDTAVANAVAGVNPAVAVQAATTQASDTSGFTYNNGVSGVGATFTGTMNTAITIDGYTFTALGQRLLVKNDTQSPSGAFNGIYYVTQVQTGLLPPILTRALDYDTPSDMNNTGAIPVQNGTANADTSWLMTAQIVTVGTTPLTFVQFSYAPASIVTAASSASASKQICTSSGASKTCSYIDFPERLNIPAANCNNATGGAGWSIGSGGTVACRAGTNNFGGYISITDTSSTFAQFQLSIPADWDTATDPYISFGLVAATDTTNGHTIIPSIAISCPTATNGTVTDDHAFAATRSAATITFGGSAVANGFYTTSIQTNSTDMSGCVGGGFMIVKVGRATDTATGTIGFEYADVTFPRLLVVQAN